jgi:hypothetical protein
MSEITTVALTKEQRELLTKAKRLIIKNGLESLNDFHREAVKRDVEIGSLTNGEVIAIACSILIFEFEAA